MFDDATWWTLLSGALYFGVLIAIAAWVSLRKKPTAAIAWILTLVFIPVLGIVLFALLGNHKLPRRRRDIQRRVNEDLRARTEGMSASSHADDWPAWLEGIVRLNSELGALPMVGGNETRILTVYEESIAQMAEAVDAAERFVHVEFYLLVLDDTTRPFFEALRRAVDRGVTVRVLLDHLTAVMNPHRRRTAAHLDEIGVQWHAMLPLRPWRGQWRRPDLRNHRKLVVIDDRIGFTGSQNMVDAGYNKKSNLRRGLRWHDLMIRIEGPAVRALDAVFVSEIGDQWLVYHAQRSYYEVLLRAGVKIHLYRAPAVLHSKHFSIDDEVAVIGSSNMDIRSFQLNMEVSVLVHGREVVERLRAVEDGYRAQSRPLELRDWIARPRRQKVRDGLARLTSALQ